MVFIIEVLRAFVPSSPLLVPSWPALGWGVRRDARNPFFVPSCLRGQLLGGVRPDARNPSFVPSCLRGQLCFASAPNLPHHIDEASRSSSCVHSVSSSHSSPSSPPPRPASPSRSPSTTSARGRGF